MDRRVASVHADVCPQEHPPDAVQSCVVHESHERLDAESTLYKVAAVDCGNAQPCMAAVTSELEYCLHSNTAEAHNLTAGVEERCMDLCSPDEQWVY